MPAIKLIVSLALFLALAAYSQEVKNLYPELGPAINLSPEGERKFIEKQKRCNDFWQKFLGKMNAGQLSKEEKVLYNECSENEGEPENYYEILGPGCSWYCGGGLDTVSASSVLKGNKKVTYLAGNIHDLSYETAWIEGADGYGIGEYAEYSFPPENPRITRIIVVNGYVKTDRLWRDNSRVKKLMMYLNGKPFAILNLKDSKEEQSFTFEPLGHADRSNLSNLPRWSMRFEILEVYKGDKYDDTAITEIYFDGIDVH